MRGFSANKTRWQPFCQAIDAMGLQQTQMFATLFDGAARHSPEGCGVCSGAASTGASLFAVVFHPSHIPRCLCSLCPLFDRMWFKERAEEVGFQQAVAERDSGEPIAPGASKPSVPAVPPHDAELHSKL